MMITGIGKTFPTTITAALLKITEARNELDAAVGEVGADIADDHDAYYDIKTALAFIDANIIQITQLISPRWLRAK